MNKKNILYGLGIILLIGMYLLYNRLFLYSWGGNIIFEKIGEIWYSHHFMARQEKPHSFFTADVFPVYTKWCHDNKKLCNIIPLQQLYADIQRISSIQFVWWQGTKAEMLGLGKMLENLTTLAPYWDYPYTFWMLLVPMPKQMVVQQDTWDQQQSRIDASNLGKKWEYYTCDPIKIAWIRNLEVNDFIKKIYNTGEKIIFENPCSSYERAHYAAFNQFYYNNDADESAQNYKISAFQTDSPKMTPLMAALVYGRSGKHLKSASLRYDRYLSIASQQNTESDNILKDDMERALKKAVFEVQLQIITEAEELAGDSCDKSYECLQDKWYIKTSVEKSYDTICQKWQERNNIRCLLLYVWLQQKRITKAGELQYPLWWEFMYGWSTDYKSRWILEK